MQLNFWASGGPRGFEMASLHESLEALGQAFIAFGQVLNFSEQDCCSIFNFVLVVGNLFLFCRWKMTAFLLQTLLSHTASSIDSPEHVQHDLPTQKKKRVKKVSMISSCFVMFFSDRRAVSAGASRKKAKSAVRLQHLCQR